MTNKEAIAVCRALWVSKEPNYTEEEIRQALDLAIKALEERPQGEWIDSYPNTHIAYECSNCHIQMPILDYYHFCSNCGADMRQEEGM